MFIGNTQVFCNCYFPLGSIQYRQQAMFIQSTKPPMTLVIAEKSGASKCQEPAPNWKNISYLWHHAIFLSNLQQWWMAILLVESVIIQLIIPVKGYPEHILVPELSFERTTDVRASFLEVSKAFVSGPTCNTIVYVSV